MTTFEKGKEVDVCTAVKKKERNTTSETYERLHQAVLERIRSLRPIDDDFMRDMFQNNMFTTGDLFNDGEHILYVDGEYRGDDEIGDLMHDFNCSDPHK